MINKILPALFISMNFIFFSCNSTDPNAPLIERNEEVKEYFATLEDIVDEYCNMVETMVHDAKAIEDKETNGEETTFMDGLKMLENMGSSMFKMAELSEKIENMKDQHPEFEQKLTAADFKEFMGIYTKMIKRFYDMAKELDEMEKDKEANQVA